MKKIFLASAIIGIFTFLPLQGEICEARGAIKKPILTRGTHETDAQWNMRQKIAANNPNRNQPKVYHGNTAGGVKGIKRAVKNAERRAQAGTSESTVSYQPVVQYEKKAVKQEITKYKDGYFADIVSNYYQALYHPEQKDVKLKNAMVAVDEYLKRDKKNHRVYLLASQIYREMGDCKKSKENFIEGIIILKEKIKKEKVVIQNYLDYAIAFYAGDVIYWDDYDKYKHLPLKLLDLSIKIAEDKCEKYYKKATDLQVEQIDREFAEDHLREELIVKHQISLCKNIMLKNHKELKVDCRNILKLAGFMRGETFAYYKGDPKGYTFREVAGHAKAYFLYERTGFQEFFKIRQELAKGNYNWVKKDVDKASRALLLDLISSYKYNIEEIPVYW